MIVKSVVTLSSKLYFPSSYMFGREQIYLPSKNSSNKTKNFPLEKANQLTDRYLTRNVLNVITLQFVLQYVMLSISHFMSLCFSVTDYLYALPTDFLMKHL